MLVEDLVQVPRNVSCDLCVATERDLLAYAFSRGWVFCQLTCVLVIYYYTTCVAQETVYS
jgi:hypothetical protein